MHGVVIRGVMWSREDLVPTHIRCVYLGMLPSTLHLVFFSLQLGIVTDTPTSLGHEVEMMHAEGLAQCCASGEPRIRYLPFSSES